MIVKHTLITVLGEAGAVQKCLPANWKPVIPDLMRDEWLVRKKGVCEVKTNILKSPDYNWND